jgi:hypothetical protein
MAQTYGPQGVAGQQPTAADGFVGGTTYDDRRD